MKKLLCGLFLMLPLLAFAQDHGGPVVPNAGNVTLPLDEYNRLLDLAHKPGAKIDVPPVGYAIKRADLKLRVADEMVKGTVQLQGETFHKGATKVPLTSGMTILDAHQEGKSLPLLQEGGTHTAVLAGGAEFSVTLDAGLPMNVEAGRASFYLPAPSAGSVRLSLVVPGDHTSVRIAPGLITARTSENGQTTIEATLVPGQAANISWVTREIAVPVAPREVRFLSEMKTLVSVSEADLKVAVLADINVVQGEPAQFEIQIPAGYEVTGATGPSVESSETQGDKLILKIAAPAQRAHQFLISMERSISATKIDAPFLSFKDSQRETGEILVEAGGTIELTATEGGGLKRMDFKETNAYLRSLSRFPMQAAFRYHKQPTETPSLALEWTRFPDSSVLAAVAERAVVTTLVTSEGKSLTEVSLVVRNQAQPFLKVALPAGASILSAEVAGEKVKPVEGSDGNRVPLLRPGFRPTGSYTVSFVFMHSGTPFAKKGGSDLSLPKMDVPINLLQWEVFLPEQYKVKDFGGDAFAANLLPASAVDAEFGRLNGYYQLGAVGGAAGALVSNESLLPGQLGGYIVDSSGAVVPNARVTVTQVENGATRNAVTDQSGHWVISNLPSGTVKITTNANGFRSYVREIAYDASRPTNYNSRVDVAAATETVTVMSGVEDRSVSQRIERDLKKEKQAQENAASPNVMNLQRRVAGVLPVRVDVPRAGNSYRFVRPLVLDEETKVTFTYKTK